MIRWQAAITFRPFASTRISRFIRMKERPGKLNYDAASGTTSTFVPNICLKVGVDYLYKEFAAGTLAGYNYDYGTNRINTAVELQDAIWFLMGFDAEMKVTNAATAWTTNTFLRDVERHGWIRLDGRL